jgi:hypothetical protein
MTHVVYKSAQTNFFFMREKSKKTPLLLEPIVDIHSYILKRIKMFN